MKTIGHLTDLLRKHGDDIGKKANAGDKLCNDLINAYTMLWKCPGDNMALGLCWIKLEEYLSPKENS